MSLTGHQAAPGSASAPPAGAELGGSPILPPASYVSAGFSQAAAICTQALRVGTNQICDGRELNASKGAYEAAFAAVIAEHLEGTPPTRVARIDLASGVIEIITHGPNTDRLPKYAPDGNTIAFLSDREREGDFQLYLYDCATRAIEAAPRVEGWIEYLHWSPDGGRILLGVADHGADIASSQGAAQSARAIEHDKPAWAPFVDTGENMQAWRHAWIYSLSDNAIRRVSPAALNVWEAVWCGGGAIAAIVSSSPSEGAWYRARLALLSLADGAMRELYTPRDQLGWPAATSDGRRLAVVEAFCSDRWVVAGDLLIIDTHTGERRRLDTSGVDVTFVDWTDETRLAVAGHRGIETVLLDIDLREDNALEIWRSTAVSIVGRYATTALIKNGAEHVVITESHTQPPQVAVIGAGSYRVVQTLSDGSLVAPIDRVRCIAWQGEDGLPLEGLLLTPKGQAPFPTVMNIHGGPVSHWRPTWLARAHLPLWLLLERGFAVFLPNPRGGSGRGQDFARAVIGDVGGSDARDCLLGLESLVRDKLADAARLGVMGGSYGGYMTSWLITQDHRFAAAVSVAPMTNAVSERFLSNIPHFVTMFVGGGEDAVTSRYFERSPILFADGVQTPVLNICGALDRCTPAAEAIQFHNALAMKGKPSTLALYPKEGHGIRKPPALIDYAARVADWFEEHLRHERS